MFLVNLLGFYLILFEGWSGFCSETVWQPPRPSISHLQAISDRQTLMVSWLVSLSGLVGDVYEIQIGRAENHTVIYNRNVSLLSLDSDEYTWAWTSDLPLECVDHSVRIRRLYNKSVPSPWSSWRTNDGVQVEDKTQMFPSQRVLIEGTSAMFCCVPPRGLDITDITFDNKQHTPISVGAGVKAIMVVNLTIPNRPIKGLTLSCRDSTGKKSRMWNYVSFPPQKPKDLSCVTTDMTAVHCTWDSGREQHLYELNKQTITLHIENSDRAPINCKPSSCIFPAVPQLEEYNIRVMVKDPLGEETESHSFNISDRVRPVVEWDGVSLGVTDTTVSWIVQGKLTRPNLLCQLTTDPGSTTELSCNSVRGSCTAKLEPLLPSTRYSTRVRCSVNGRLWGEWTQPIAFTTCPLVTLDLWRKIKQQSDPNSRQVSLFWTPHVSGPAATANIQGYLVQWSQDGQNWTECKDGGQTQAEVSIGPGQCDFSVQAVLRTSCTVTYTAHITIPQRDDRGIRPVEKRFSSGTASGFNLSWDEQDSAVCGYTVEWCILGNAVPCTLRWMKVPEGRNTLFLPARDFKAGCRYTFNIYECTENGHRLLETQTGYSQELKFVQSPSLVEPVQSTSSSVTLEWRYDVDDPAHPAFITGYLVTVQEVAPDTPLGHVAYLFNVTVAEPQRKSVTIDGLQQNHEYAFSVSALTKEGPGQPASITIRTGTNLHRPWTHLDSAHLAKILTPILLLLCCTILLWPQRKTLKWLKGIFVYPAGMNIKIPELDSFLHETVEWLQPQRVDECSSCNIEILYTRPPLNEPTTLSDAGPQSTPPSPGTHSCPPLQAEYCPQSVTVLLRDREALLCVTNKAYFHTVEEDLSEAQVRLSETCEPSESLQGSCSVEYDYISNGTGVSVVEYEDQCVPA
ncbi:oncostatin-M-specific receptor subunit beta isoform X1 [Acanthopagrus latus]|uniref:oncostatin-M-specific receptor subunit beta isoform X1 n=1 Tax=Acanthopagrus latus TaxID=8177 RepID=UPI00187CAC79|nr:oncostatin-M-specific receptor subunit beta isoform X1 [Acanthopagrus latus]